MPISLTRIPINVRLMLWWQWSLLLMIIICQILQWNMQWGTTFQGRRGKNKGGREGPPGGGVVWNWVKRRIRKENIKQTYELLYSIRPKMGKLSNPQASPMPLKNHLKQLHSKEMLKYFPRQWTCFLYRETAIIMMKFQLQGRNTHMHKVFLYWFRKGHCYKNWTSQDSVKLGNICNLTKFLLLAVTRKLLCDTVAYE